MWLEKIVFGTRTCAGMMSHSQLWNYKSLNANLP